MNREFDLSLEGEIEQCDPLYTRVLCNDGEERATGGVRIPPDVLSELHIEYPEDVLPADVPSLDDGVSPFDISIENECLVYESADFTGGHRLHRQLWTGIHVENLDMVSTSNSMDGEEKGVVKSSEEEYRIKGQTGLYSPQLDMMVLTKMSGDNTKMRPELLVYDMSSDEVGVVQSLGFRDIHFYDVPDTILTRILPEEYNPTVIANNI